jgi:hypothetical protein
MAAISDRHHHLVTRRGCFQRQILINAEQLQKKTIWSLSSIRSPSFSNRDGESQKLRKQEAKKETSEETP